MNADPNQAKAIFLEAVEGHAPDGWPAFLDQACAGQPDLRRRVEVLLTAHRDAGTAAHRAGDAELAGLDPNGADERPGSVIGPYKLLQQIGEGGMGTVFMAEQTQPVRRKVALKVIKAGMDSRQVIARFEAERQALALMDHVNIARVFDGGATGNGRPYFVMELVHGVPITRYCDDNRLSPRERLELFVGVCQAIQHAHQKGVIHRDVKPSNVMVTLYDGKAVPKVIDFGVAKATEQKLTERTLFTQCGALVGTLEYMSPEQACPPSALYRFRKFARRNKRTLASAALLGALLLLGVVLLAVNNVQIKEEQQRTDAQKTRAETALREARDNLQLADENLGLA